MKEQIKEMANDIAKICPDLVENGCGQINCVTHLTLSLYNAGYRKQSEPISCGHENGVEWISVTERLPPENCRVLVYSPTDGINLGHRLDEVGRFYVTKPYPEHPTHWMPLPEPPKEAK